MVSKALNRSIKIPMVSSLHSIAWVIFETRYVAANSVECFSIKTKLVWIEKIIFLQKITHATVGDIF